MPLAMRAADGLGGGSLERLVSSSTLGGGEEGAGDDGCPDAEFSSVMAAGAPGGRTRRGGPETIQFYLVSRYDDDYLFVDCV